jgi:hypothetical protein
MVDVCECAANWRIEIADLLTGVTRHVITPVSFEFETAFLEAGRGSITFNIRTSDVTGGQVIVNPQEVAPGEAAIYFSRIHGGAATPDSPIHMFGGYVETLQSDSFGTVTLGFAEMQKYLDYRLIRSDLSWSGVDQNIIPAELVEYARGANLSGGTVDPIPGPGIQLEGQPVVSGVQLRDRNYEGVDRKIIGEAIKEYLQIINGPVYQMSHTRLNPGIWLSTMFFSDDVIQTAVKTVEWSQLTDFSLTLDANDLANTIDAFGEPFADGSANIQTQPNPAAGFLARFDAAPSFPTVSNPATLNGQAAGYQEDHFGTALDLRLMFSGLEYGQTAGGPTLTLDDLVPGHEIALDIRSPYWEFIAGPQFPSSYVARLGRVSVSVGLEGPEQIAVQVVNGEGGVPGTPGFIEGSSDDCVDC